MTFSKVKGPKTYLNLLFIKIKIAFKLTGKKIEYPIVEVGGSGRLESKNCKYILIDCWTEEIVNLF